MISFKEINGFVKGQTLSGNDVWRKFIDKSEFQELYDINFFAEWNGKIFNCGYDANGIIILRESKDISYAKEHNFEQLDRFFYVKRVPIEQCTKLGILKQDLLQDEYGNVSEEKIVSTEVFEKLYYDNVTALK